MFFFQKFCPQIYSLNVFDVWSFLMAISNACVEMPTIVTNLEPELFFIQTNPFSRKELF